MLAKMQRTEPCLTRTEGTWRLWKQKSHPSKILCRGGSGELWYALKKEYGQSDIFLIKSIGQKDIQGISYRSTGKQLG